MEGTRPSTVNSIGMFDMLKGVGMITIVLAHTAELYPMQISGGLSLTAFFPFIYREALMAAFFIASGYGFRKRSIGKCIQQQLRALLKPYCITAVCTSLLHLLCHYMAFHYFPSSVTETLKVAGGFLLGLPHTTTYAGQQFFSTGPMWYLLSLLIGWVLLDAILNIFPEKYTHWAVLGIMLLGWGTTLVWELPFSLSQGAVIVPYLYIGYLAKKNRWLDKPLPRRTLYILLGGHSSDRCGSSACPEHRLHFHGRVDPGPAEHPAGCRHRLFVHPPVHAAQPFYRPHRTGPAGHRPQLAEHLLHPHGGAYRHSVVSVRGSLYRPPAAGYAAAERDRVYLHRAGVRPAEPAAQLDRQSLSRTAAGPAAYPRAFAALISPAAAVQPYPIKQEENPVMNNDAPQTLDAAGSRVAELEQQLRLSDEGVSRLAQRCLELEQQVLKYEAVLASQGADTEQGALLLPQLFYDSGSGFSPHECLTVAPDSYDELTHEVSAVFELPVEARALRLDPGEFACCITDFSLSDERLSYHIINGNALQEGTMLFMNIDPNLTVESAVGFPAGLRFAVKYRYYPLGRYLHEQPGKAPAAGADRAQGRDRGRVPSGHRTAAGGKR